jgi:hypothetical protein
MNFTNKAFTAINTNYDQIHMPLEASKGKAIMQVVIRTGLVVHWSNMYCFEACLCYFHIYVKTPIIYTLS